MNQACEKEESDVVSIQQARPAGNTFEHSMLSNALVDAWLAWQCRMIAGLFRGQVFAVSEEGELAELISSWPDNGEIPEQVQAMAVESLRQKQGIVRAQQQYSSEHQRGCDIAASPLIFNNRPIAVIVVMMSTRAELQHQAVLQLLQWGGLWVETLLKQDSASSDLFSSFAVKLSSTILAHEDMHPAVMDIVNQIADQYHCERVSLGFVKGMSVELQALSHVSSFDSRTQLVRKIEAAMTEAVDQGTSIAPDLLESDVEAVSRANRELSSLHSDSSVCSILMPGRQEAVGVITLERAGNLPFDVKTIVKLDSLASLIGPVIASRQDAEQGFLGKCKRSAKNALRKVFGPARLKLKLVSATVAVLIAALAFIPGTYRVTAPASIEGAVRQMLVAPVTGFVKQSEIRAGDIVRAGQIVTTLDDRDFKLELQKWQSDRNKIEKEYQDALASRDRSQLSILRAQIEQVDAELKLVEQKIAQTRLVSPFDGIVVSGDLSQKLGAPVEIGQSLFEIAPLDNYRIVLEVDEHDVAGLEAGKQGHLVMAALPRDKFKFSLEKLLPVAVSGQGNNYFRVEASLNKPSPLLRPGMRGVAKVEIGERSLLWNLTHSVVDRFRLWFWSAGL